MITPKILVRNRINGSNVAWRVMVMATSGGHLERDKRYGWWCDRIARYGSFVIYLE